MSDKKYCYPDSSILINKPGIKDPDKLLKAEIRLTGYRMIKLQQEPIKGRFDFDHLKQIHRYVFQDLYEWAGVPRTVDIGKGNLFCPVRNINSYAASVFGSFARDCMAAKADPDTFIRTLAKHYGDLNALHPFREGNGRTQREFTRELCLACGYDFDLTCTKHNEMLYASKLSFDLGDSSSLEGIFKKAVTPIFSCPFQASGKSEAGIP